MHICTVLVQVQVNETAEIGTEYTYGAPESLSSLTASSLVDCQ